MRGVYTVEYEVSISAAETLLLLEAPSDAVLEILSASITNDSIDENEQLEAGLYVVITKGTPSGTAVTPEPHEPGDQAVGGTYLAHLGGGSEPDAYNSVAIDHQGFSNLAGYRYDPLPEERPIIPPSGLAGLRLLSAPDAATVLVAQVVFREIG
jgi:hypothetical protein